MRRLVGLLLVILPASLPANWPQWRGPNSDGSAPKAYDLPTTWTQTENVLWRTATPSWSAATPIVWGDRIFITSAEEGSPRLRIDPAAGSHTVKPGRTKVFLLAVNRKNGALVWQREIDTENILWRKQNSASPSPVTDGRFVWVMTGNGKLVCFTMDGKEVWRRDIQAEYGRFGLNHGYASTPLLHGDRLYVQVLHGFKTKDPSYVFAVDKVTGKTLWRVLRPTDAVQESQDNYSTPQIAIIKGRPQLVIAGADCVTAHDLNTGKEIWRIRGFNPSGNPFNRTIASAVVVGEHIFWGGSRGRPFVGFRAGGEGDLTGKAEIWTNDLGADVPTPTTDGKYLYLLKDNGTLSAVEALTGKVVYQGQRLAPGTYSASPLLADGKIYAASEGGAVAVVRAGPAFELLAVNNLDSLTLGSPVAVDNQIFIRTADYLYCIQKR